MVGGDIRYRLWAAITLVLLALGASAEAASAQGIYISSAGPFNRGMGGASTAAPLDALGATYWNPAAIWGLDSSELAFGIELVSSNHKVTSAVGAFGGSSDARNGVFPVPAIAWVHRTSKPAIVIGLALSSVAGFKTNLLADPTNPVLAPAPGGLGRVSSEASFFQLAPMIAIGLSRSISAGIGPIVTLGQVAAEPFVFAPPNSDGRYSPARATRYHWGGGAQAGLYYARRSLRLAVSLKTPAWMETFQFFGEDASGAARVLTLELDLPMIVSLGTAYVGDPWVVALDARYFDYAHADGFRGPAAFDGTGALQGLGWRSIVAIGAGVQRRLSEPLIARVGYVHNQSPVRNEDSFVNLASPLIYQHTLSAGFSLRVSPQSSVNLAYSYFFPEEIVGPIISPVVGPVPGSSVRNRLDVHVVSLGVSARY
jgi:long-chain fatty acid transport protein